MKICFITERFYPFYGGSETRYYKIAENLVKLGHNVLIVTGNGDSTGNHKEDIKLKSKEITSGFQIFRLIEYRRIYPLISQRSPVDLLRFGIRLNQILPALIDEYDIVEMNSLPYLHTIPILSSRLNKIILTWHEVWGNYWNNKRIVNKVGRSIEQRLLNKGRAQIYVSKFTQKRAQFYRSQHRMPSMVISNGVEKVIQYSEKSYQDRAILLFVGRLVPEKNVFPFLLKSYVKFKKIYPDSELHIVGYGPGYQNIQRFAEKNLNIYLHGNLNPKNLDKLYKKINLFLLPSEREGSGISALEAMSKGNPVITLGTKYNATAHEIVKHNFNGYVSSRTDFVNYMIKGYLERKRLGANAILTANQYIWSSIASNLVEFYQSL